jgi:hypothetical protein
MGAYPMQPLSPVLPMFDKTSQTDELTPVSWKEYGNHYLNRDQAADEEQDKKHANNHILNDMINAVKRARNA